MMSIASWTRAPPARAWVKVSTSWLGLHSGDRDGEAGGADLDAFGDRDRRPAPDRRPQHRRRGSPCRDSAVGSMPMLNAKIQKALVRIAVTIAVAMILNIAPPVPRPGTSP